MRELRGRGRGMPVTGVTFLVGGLCLAGLPPSGLFAGHSVTEHAVLALGWWWYTPLSVAVSALTAGAVLRVWLVVWRGSPAGSASGNDSDAGHEGPETRVTLRTLPWTMLAPGIALLAGGLLAGLLPGGPVARAADQFTGRDHYAALVLSGRLAHPHPPAADPWTLPGLAGSALTLLLAAAVAAVAVHRRASPRPAAPRRPASRLVSGSASAIASGGVAAARALAGRLHAAHSGHIGDYAAWLTVGVAVLALLTARF
jgi:multicomponent Na+:H+ antiporter subunit D